MGWPQYAYLALITFIGLGMVAGQHGKPRTGTHSFWSKLIDTALILGLLWAGGFFG